MKASSSLQRARQLWAGLVTDRDAPDFEALAATTDPWRFVWAMLPHAARSFAPCIVLLPEPMARTSAVAYLYCRILDTYEDLVPDPRQSALALEAFVERLSTTTETPRRPAPPLHDPALVTARDRAHALLVAGCDRIDAAFVELPRVHRQLVRELVTEMAACMGWARRTLAAHGGVLPGAAELDRYCDGVLGAPIRFCCRLQRVARGLDPTLPDEVAQDTREAGVFLQLANVIRDVEPDLDRGVAYVPQLAPDLGAARPGRPLRVQQARRDLLAHAVSRAPAYGRLVDASGFPRWSLGRASAQLMLGFCWRHYRRVAQGLTGPRTEPDSRARLAWVSLRAGLSPRWAQRDQARMIAELQACVGLHRAGSPPSRSLSWDR